LQPRPRRWSQLLECCSIRRQCRALAAKKEEPKIADDAYEDVCQSIFELRTCVSRGLGLVPTLAEYLHEYSEVSGIAVQLEVADGPLDPLPPPSEVQAVRIIQEALANVRKHAHSDRARVCLRRDGAWVRVAVEDDGIGWDPAAPPARLHYGITCGIEVDRIHRP
jgi:two-component system nitrate/nitrite sensor histidine kinase NarX